ELRIKIGGTWYIYVLSDTNRYYIDLGLANEIGSGSYIPFILLFFALASFLILFGSLVIWLKLDFLHWNISKAARQKKISQLKILGAILTISGGVIGIFCLVIFHAFLLSITSYGNINLSNSYYFSLATFCFYPLMGSISLVITTSSKPAKVVVIPHAASSPEETASISDDTTDYTTVIAERLVFDSSLPSLPDLSSEQLFTSLKEDHLLRIFQEIIALLHQPSAPTNSSEQIGLLLSRLGAGHLSSQLHYLVSSYKSVEEKQIAEEIVRFID
ncbi:MAG: hypothetical protein ACFFDW_14085, partial [Candidatus Thorarchaeota archaeon]